MDQIPTMTLQCYAAASRGENFDVAESAPSELLGCELLMSPVLKKKERKIQVICRESKRKQCECLENVAFEDRSTDFRSSYRRDGRGEI